MEKKKPISQKKIKKMKLPATSCGVSLAELRRSLTRLYSHELRRGRPAISLCSKLQNILAKANENPGLSI